MRSHQPGFFLLDSWIGFHTHPYLTPRGAGGGGSGFSTHQRFLPPSTGIPYHHHKSLGRGEGGGVRCPGCLAWTTRGESEKERRTDGRADGENGSGGPGGSGGSGGPGGPGVSAEIETKPEWFHSEAFSVVRSSQQRLHHRFTRSYGCVCVFTSIKCVSVGHCVSVCMCVCERAHPGVYTCGAALPVASTSVASTK